ncbi:MAG: DUF4160 domain-containing protein, partial [Bacillus sp. (in: Bacteria)]|nr:DUF4160 domain-containing protein [Bacillus sp. (in: firmicutes)]
MEKARVIKGALPSKQLKLVLAWCILHQDELMQNWELAKDGKLVCYDAKMLLEKEAFAILREISFFMNACT